MKASALGPKDLGARTDAGWEAYFLIGIFPDGSDVRWVKLELFSGGKNPRRHCISSVEGLDGEGRSLLLLARRDGVEERRAPLPPEAFVRSPERLEIATPTLRWKGSFPALLLETREPALRARTESHDAIYWIRWPRVVSYWSALGPIALEAEGKTLEGLGLVEHAWGMQTHLDMARVLPGRWQWDVLAFPGGKGVAALSARLLGELRGLRAGGNVSSFALGRSLSFAVEDWTEENGRRVPARWSSRIRLGQAEIDYVARANTPVAPVLPRGGYLGFSFEGAWREEGATRAVSGTGYSEYSLSQEETS